MATELVAHRGDRFHGGAVVLTGGEAREQCRRDRGHRNGVLDRRLDGREFVADAYSIADIAIWPWIARYDWQTVDLDSYPNVKRWYLTIARRPAVQRGYHVPKQVQDIPMPA